MKFYKCEHCGNVIAYLEDKGVKVVCCGDPMGEYVPKTADMATEKHVPVITTEKHIVTVKVGSTDHPMTKEHYIKWIILETTQGYQRKLLNPGDKPQAEFAICKGDKVVAAYELCNIHGLWENVL